MEEGEEKTKRENHLANERSKAYNRRVIKHHQNMEKQQQVEATKNKQLRSLSDSLQSMKLYYQDIVNQYIEQVPEERRQETQETQENRG